MACSAVDAAATSLSPRLERLVADRKARWQAQKPYWKSHDPIWIDGHCPIVNRSQAFTQAHRAAEGRAPILRAAKAFLAECETMPLHIDEDELIVGYYLRSIASFRYAGGIYASRTFDRAGWSEEEIRAAEETLAYWKGNTCNDAFNRMPRVSEWRREQSIWGGASFGGHNVIGMNSLIELGLPGLRAEVEKAAARNAKDSASRDFYEAMQTVCDAIAVTARRYGEEAARCAKRHPDPARAAELERIARNCLRVSTERPETLWEAAQLYHVAHMLDGYEDYGRLDQYLLPYYRADLEAGWTTPEEAREVIGSLMLRSRYSASVICLSGVLPDGSDGTNDVSWMILELAGRFGLPSPEILIRYHKEISPEFLRRVCELTGERRIQPVFYNDDVVVPALVRDGMSLEDARQYAAVGCNHIVVPGLTNTVPSSQFLLLPCLLLALNDGVSTKTGEQLGPHTGNPGDFQSIEDVWRAYDEQVRYFARRMGEESQACDRVRMERDVYAMRSLLVRDCVATGLSYVCGGARYNNTEINTDGVANVADSLAAIKRLVFEEKTVTLPEVVEAVRNNFAGAESLRQRLLNRAPKFGNDDDYVDQFAVRAFKHICGILEAIPTGRGGHHVVMPTVGMGIGNWNDDVGSASPDGRRKEDPVADSIGPSHGRDRKGPTAMLNSVAKVDMGKAVCGATLNMKFHPTMAGGENGPQRVASLLRTYFDRGGINAQVQVVSSDTLRAAQREPENYRDLVVRVAGYNATFVDLNRVIQDDIIARTELR